MRCCVSSTPPSWREEMPSYPTPSLQPLPKDRDQAPGSSVKDETFIPRTQAEAEA